MKLRPSKGRLIVKRFDPPTVSEGGVALPSDRLDDHSEADVLAVGEGVTSAAKGDRIVFTSYVGAEVTLEGKKVCVITDKDVLLKIVPEDPETVGWKINQPA